MKLDVVRYSGSKNSTLGHLVINDVFECYTLEDEHRTLKVFGDTRIPAGTYKIGLRTVGGTTGRYSKKFPSFHKGMLEVQNVPNFKYVLIHIGNDEDDTAGCLLVGDTTNNNKIVPGFIGSSTQAYIRVYKKVLEALERNEPVNITYHDWDRRG